jgi:large conductance mechanosensitive channel
VGIVHEFKEFAIRGNVVDLAVGIVLGTAFGRITTSLVNDVLMPPIGVLLGGADFSYLGVTLKEATETDDAVLLGYGAFINTLLDFVIVAVALFALVKFVNAVKRQNAAAPPPPAPPTREEILLTEIRDALRSR